MRNGIQLFARSVLMRSMQEDSGLKPVCSRSMMEKAGLTLVVQYLTFLAMESFLIMDRI